MGGPKVQSVRQPNDNTIILELYGRGHTKHLLISCHPEFFRVYFTTRKSGTLQNPPQFCTALRTNLIGLSLESVSMVGSDRILRLDFGDWSLIAELMGKHSNMILVNANNTIQGAAQWIGKAKSRRPIQAQQKYENPPVLRGLPNVRDFKLPPKTVEPRQSVANSTKWNPGFSSTIGAYPFDLSDQLRDWIPCDSISYALESYYLVEIQRREIEAKRSWILSQLNRVLLAREVALNSLIEARETGGKAAGWQRNGELLLAYAHEVKPEMETVELTDYDGSPLTIRLDPELSAKDNALRYFDKAKRAKGRQGLVSEQIDRIEASAEQLRSVIAQTQEAKSLQILGGIEEEVRKNRWTHEQPIGKGGVTERPYEGHRIRDVLGPNNYKILYGENAESNDYLTLRVAKSNDYWLHVRGHTSAHVVIQTHNQPEKVPKEVLMAAAKIAVQNSNQKHAGYVSVDYVLKKYVRKPKGAAKGSALYVNEKTLHVEGGS
jgi:predicted ribosome quality control (RQC) complex YloA/Tae2 family protein